MKHQLARIKFILQQGRASIISLIVGISGYWLLLTVFNRLLGLELGKRIILVAAVRVAPIIIFVHRLYRRNSISMERENLQRQPSQRELVLLALNRASAIITSSLDTQRIFDSLVEELRKLVDVDWAAIVLFEDSGLYFPAVSSHIGSVRKVGERVPIKDTATEWVASRSPKRSER